MGRVNRKQTTFFRLNEDGLEKSGLNIFLNLEIGLCLWNYSEDISAGGRKELGASLQQGPSQDLETGCPKVAIVKVLGVLLFKGDHNILILQP